MNTLKKVHARFYATDRGEEPVRSWLKSLDRDDCREIGKDIQKLELGWPLGLPVCRPLGGGLWEVRSNLSHGTIGRVIFCFVGKEMVLLHGFIKKTQQTPKKDLELARARYDALLRQ